VEVDELWRFRAEADTQELVRLSGFTAAELPATAGNLLLVAHGDDAGPAVGGMTVCCVSLAWRW
jgi:hypothetical protein